MHRDWSGSLVGSVPVVVGSWHTRILYTRRETAPQTFREETGHRGLRGEEREGGEGNGERGGREREEIGGKRERERGEEERRDRRRKEW